MKPASELLGNLIRLLLVLSPLSLQSRSEDSLIINQGQDAPSSLGKTPNLPPNTGSRSDPQTPHSKALTVAPSDDSTKSSVLVLRAPSPSQVSLSLTNNSGISSPTMSSERTISSTTATSGPDPCAFPSAVGISLLLGVSLLWLVTFIILYLCICLHCQNKKSRRARSRDYDSGHSTESPDMEAGHRDCSTMPPSSYEKEFSRTLGEPKPLQTLLSIPAELETSPAEVHGDSAKAARNSRYVRYEDQDISV